MTDLSKLTCWIVTDGKAGTQGQCVGLARALGISYKVKRLQARFPWTLLPAHLWPCPLEGLSSKGDRLSPPFPDVVIAASRVSSAPAAAIRKLSHGKTFVIQVQDPRVDLNRYDLVIAPMHDGLSGPNVLRTAGALHQLSHAHLEQATQSACVEQFSHLPRPWIVTLLGGNNKSYSLAPSVLQKVGENIAAAAQRLGGTVLATASRRTDKRSYRAFQQTLQEVPHYCWNGQGDNPYMAFLALADVILVTADSVSMLSEALFTGKPVYVLPLPGGTPKFQRFHKHMIQKGYTQWFHGDLSPHSYEPLNEMERIAGEVKERLEAWISQRNHS